MLLDLVVIYFNIAEDNYEEADLNLSRQSGNNNDKKLN
jgi:hypothetical protein